MSREEHEHWMIQRDFFADGMRYERWLLSNGEVVVGLCHGHIPGAWHRGSALGLDYQLQPLPGKSPM